MDPIHPLGPVGPVGPVGPTGPTLSKGWPRVAAAAGLWLFIAAGAWAWLGRHEDGVPGGAAALLQAVEGPFAPLFLLFAFLVRPLTLLPVTVLTAFAGFLLGPVLGFVVASVAVAATSLIPYAFTRLARGRPVARPTHGWRANLQTRAFEAVLMARLAMMPGDLVNVAAGLLRVPVRTFVAATVVGGSPGILVGVLAGAGVESFRVDGVSVAWPLIVASATILLVSVVIASVLRRRVRPPAEG